VGKMLMQSAPSLRSSSIHRCVLLLDEFRKVNPNMPMQMAAMLMLVADKPGVSLKEIGQRLGMGKSSVNRDAAILADGWGTPLIRYGRDPADGRNNICHLTPVGQRLVQSVVHYIGA
jgi:DNA-binding MarR family transcriptional regulator